MLKRNILAALLAALMLTAGGALAQETCSSAAAFVRAPLYDAPDTGAQELMRYYVGTRVEVIREADAEFVQVVVGDAGGSLMGYMEKRDLAFGEAEIRAFQAEWVTYRDVETQTCRLYSYPDKSAPVIDEAFNLTVQRVIGAQGDQWLHVEVFEGGTGFVALDELEGETVHEEAAPYIEAEPTEDELTRGEALERAKQILLEQQGADAQMLGRCKAEVKVLYYYETPGQLLYSISFCDPDTGYLYAGIDLLAEGKSIVHVSFGNG